MILLHRWHGYGFNEPFFARGDAVTKIQENSAYGTWVRIDGENILVTETVDEIATMLGAHLPPEPPKEQR